jgi:hypothetical protein
VASCKAEPRFATFREADTRAWFEMSRTRVAKGGSPVPLAAYKCTDCEGFHVGPRPARKQKLSGRAASDVA